MDTLAFEISRYVNFWLSLQGVLHISTAIRDARILAKVDTMLKRTGKKSGLFSRFALRRKPAKPSVRPNRMALAARSEGQARATDALREVVRLSLENKAKLTQ